MRMRICALVLVLPLAACGDSASGDDSPDAAPQPIPPGEDSTRDIVSTALAFDLDARTATATITLAASPSMAASFEIGDIEVAAVRSGGRPLEFADQGARLDIGVPASTAPLVLEIDYSFAFHAGFMGATPDWTLTWPYYCGNMFPCRSNPSDGTSFTMSLTGVPAGETAVFPATLSEAPAYQIAWAIDAYEHLDLGTTAAGTHVQAWHRANETARITAGTANLRAAFEWLETNIGPYRFGTEVGTVGVTWGAGALGGMEHHPMWHIASGALGSEEVNVHEAAHGWFGDGIRIACWEDFVLSEGTVTYLAGRALDVVAPSVGQAIWDDYETQLADITPTDPVWPDSCGAIDVLEDNLFTDAPYIRGAFFYRGVALRVGAAELDQALAAFYTEYGGKAAKMSDMLRVIQETTGYDPTTCANSWLRQTTIPAVGACPP
jgi:aminopeptidase N